MNYKTYASSFYFSVKYIKFLARKLESSVKLNGHHKEVKASRAGNDLQMGNVEIQTTIREEIPDMRHSSIVDSRIPHERKVMDAALDPMEDEDRIQNTSVQADTQTYATVFKTKPSTITKEASTGTKSVGVSLLFLVLLIDMGISFRELAHGFLLDDAQERVKPSIKNFQHWDGGRGHSMRKRKNIIGIGAERDQNCLPVKWIKSNMMSCLF